jgi:Tfp pilus assembly protein PilF
MSKRGLFSSILLAASLAACNSLSSETEGELATYCDNAEQYFEGGEYQRAYHQWEQALKLDPSNEGARLGQAMCLYEAGRAESPESIKPLVEATERLEKLNSENFGKNQWKVELGVALAHQRWCDLYDRKIRKIAEDEKRGVAPDAAELATAKREFESHLDVAERAFKSVLAGDEKEPRDRLTCWVGLAQVAYWRGDLATSLKYANLYLDQVLRSKKFWKDQADKATNVSNTNLFKGKQSGAQLQEADLRELMASVLYQMGKTEEAAKELDTVIDMYPQRASTFMNRGILRQAQGDDDLARSDYRKFLALTELPDNDPSIIEANRRLSEVERRIVAQEARDAGLPPPQDLR